MLYVKMISKYDKTITKESLLIGREGLYFDRKGLWIRPTDLANNIIAFANANWWTIAVWISEWNFQNINELSEVRYNDLHQVCYDYITPHPKCDIEEIEFDSYKILLYHVSPDYERVFMRNDASKKVFLRVWDESKELNHEQVANLQYDRDIRRFEDQVCSEFDEDDLDMSLINEYMSILWTSDYKSVFLSRHIAKKEDWQFKYKNSAVLLFSKNPDKYLPSAYIRYVKFDWSEMHTWRSYNSIKDERIEWPMPVIVRRISEFLDVILKDYFYFDIQNWVFKSIHEYPKDARLEWVVNAVTHRSYNRVWNPILISHYDKMLIISNPWPLPSNVTVDNIQYTRYSRNPRIARVLNDMGLIRELNEWVKRIFSSMEEVKLSKPKYKNENNTVSLILKNEVWDMNWFISPVIMDLINLKFNRLWDERKTIVLYLMDNWKITTSKVQEITGKSAPTARSYLKDLVELWFLKKIERNKRDPDAFYEFKK